MNKAILFNFTVDKDSNKIFVDREFDAPRELVWAAWTQSDILDRWWAPKPWVAKTKHMDFREGGYWLYAMIGPEGETHWSRADYREINPEVQFLAVDGFCDENGEMNREMPTNVWDNRFETTTADTTIVYIELTFETLEDLETIIEMGFREGFTAGLENLDDYIASQFYLRREFKPDNTPRTSSYVNFPGNTEEAFLFYKSVFKTEFVGGIHRFGEIPPHPDHPPVDDAIKDMVLHIELPLLGGHVLMGTDAPKEMGFTVTQGNNMYINLEPDSREEAKRLFDELSDGGVVEMPIQDMFWGAYYGSFTDKFGINWMVNHQVRQ